jgi:hypothetical protein
MDALRQLEGIADAAFTAPSALHFLHDRNRPASEQWSCWVASHPEIVARSSTGHGAMELLTARISMLTSSGVLRSTDNHSTAAEPHERNRT